MVTFAALCVVSFRDAEPELIVIGQDIPYQEYQQDYQHHNDGNSVWSDSQSNNHHYYPQQGSDVNTYRIQNGSTSSLSTTSPSHCNGGGGTLNPFTSPSLAPQLPPSVHVNIPSPKPRYHTFANGINGMNSINGINNHSHSYPSSQHQPLVVDIRPVVHVSGAHESTTNYNEPYNESIAHYGHSGSSPLDAINISPPETAAESHEVSQFVSDVLRPSDLSTDSQRQQIHNKNNGISRLEQLKQMAIASMAKRKANQLISSCTDTDHSEQCTDQPPSLQWGGVCVQYGSAKGCKWGNECWQRHDDPMSVPLCSYVFTEDGCPYGDECYDRHQEHFSQRISNKMPALETMEQDNGYSLCQSIVQRLVDKVVGISDHNGDVKGDRQPCDHIEVVQNGERSSNRQDALAALRERALQSMMKSSSVSSSSSSCVTDTNTVDMEISPDIYINGEMQEEQSDDLGASEDVRNTELAQEREAKDTETVDMDLDSVVEVPPDLMQTDTLPIVSTEDVMQQKPDDLASCSEITAIEVKSNVTPKPKSPESTSMTPMTMTPSSSSQTLSSVSSPNPLQHGQADETEITQCEGTTEQKESVTTKQQQDGPTSSSQEIIGSKEWEPPPPSTESTDSIEKTISISENVQSKLVETSISTQDQDVANVQQKEDEKPREEQRNDDVDDTAFVQNFNLKSQRLNVILVEYTCYLFVLRYVFLLVCGMIYCHLICYGAVSVPNSSKTSGAGSFAENGERRSTPIAFSDY